MMKTTLFDNHDVHPSVAIQTLLNNPTRMGVVAPTSQVFLERLGPAAESLRHSGQFFFGPSADIHPSYEVAQRLTQFGHPMAGYHQIQDTIIPYTFWDMMEEMGATSVYIASPNCYHAAQTRGALKRGYRTLTEKPLAHTIEEAEQLVKLVAERYRAHSQPPPVAMCTLHYLHAANALTLIKLAQTGQLVEQLGRCIRVAGALREADDLHHFRHSWLFDPNISGGDILLDTGGHLLSILYGLGTQTIDVTAAHWDTVLEMLPETLIGGQRRHPATYFEIDFELMGGIFAPGATGHIAVGKAVPQHLAEKSLVLECERGHVELTFPTGLVVRNVSGQTLDVSLAREYALRPYENVLRRFLGLLPLKEAPETTLEIAVSCMKTIFAAYTMCCRVEYYAHALEDQPIATF